MKKLEELRAELARVCAENNTKLRGACWLVEYYMRDFGWSESEAIQYLLDLFANGTISQIKLFK